MTLIEEVENIYKSMEKIHEGLSILNDDIISLWSESDDCFYIQFENLDTCLSFLVTACNEYDKAMDYFEYYKETVMRRTMSNEKIRPFFDGIYYCPLTGLDYCVSDGGCKDFTDCPVREQEENNG